MGSFNSWLLSYNPYDQFDLYDLYDLTGLPDSIVIINNLFYF